MCENQSVVLVFTAKLWMEHKHKFILKSNNNKVGFYSDTKALCIYMYTTTFKGPWSERTSLALLSRGASSCSLINKCWNLGLLSVDDLHLKLKLSPSPSSARTGSSPALCRRYIKPQVSGFLVRISAPAIFHPDDSDGRAHWTSLAAAAAERQKRNGNCVYRVDIELVAEPLHEFLREGWNKRPLPLGYFVAFNCMRKNVKRRRTERENGKPSPTLKQ